VRPMADGFLTDPEVNPTPPAGVPYLVSTGEATTAIALACLGAETVAAV
jgi:hypothetical protein